jgi:hypothetical protein
MDALLRDLELENVHKNPPHFRWLRGYFHEYLLEANSGIHSCRVAAAECELDVFQNPMSELRGEANNASHLRTISFENRIATTAFDIENL